MTWEGLRLLASFRAQHGCAISLYLNLDPHASPTPVDLHKRARALVDEAARRSAASERELTHDQRAALRADLDRIRTYVERDLDRDGANGVVLFAASLDNLWRSLKLSQAVPDAVKVNSDLYLTPLVPLVGSGEGTLVAHVGRERGDIYLLREGRLVEVADRSEEQPRRHDQGGWSQANFQRHVDHLVQEHLRGVADELDRLLRSRDADAVVIACTDDIRAELQPMLSSAVAKALGGWMSVEAHATPAELLPGASAVLGDLRGRREQAALARWREDAGRGGRAAAGWPETLEAASDGRVDLLLYRLGVNRPAWRCPACGRAQAEDGTCPLDGTELEEHEEGLDLAVHQTLAHGGKALAVSAQLDLEPVGGLGALLRY